MIFTILGVFTEKPCSKLLECNVVYIPVITSSQVMSTASKQTMAIYNLPGHWQHHDIIEAVPLFAEKTTCKRFKASTVGFIYRTNSMYWDR